MRLIDAIKHKGKPFEIPDASRDDLPEFFIEMGYKIGAEIGVYKGEFSQKLCQASLKLFAIDPWKIYKDYTNPQGQERLDFQYEHTKRVLSPYPNCQIIRKTSMEAVEEFADESLDFVYIDALGISNWYLLGRKNPLPEEKRDKWRSWMWLKDYSEPSYLIES